MAYNTNVKQQDFQSFERVQGFQPLQTPRFADAQKKRYAEDQRQLEMAFKSERLRDKGMLAKADAEARDLNQLAELSKTLFNQVTDVAKEAAENREINDTFQALFGSAPVDEQEQKAVENAAAINEVNNDAARQVEEETGDVGVANFVRNDTPAGQVSRQFRSDRARLLAAQTDYGSFQASYLNSDAVISFGGQSLPVSVAVRSGNPALVAAAIAQGRAEFVRTYGIHQTNRAQAVSMLQGVITNTDAQLTTGYINTGIREQREEEQRNIVSQSFTAGQNSPTDLLESSFQDLANQAWTSGAYDSRGDANTAVVNGMLAGLVQRGDVEAIDALGASLKVPGQAGSELINNYAPEFAQARESAQQAQSARISQGVKDIKASMFEALAGASNQQERDAIIENAAAQLEGQGSYEQARALRQQRDDLVVVGGAERNAAVLQEGIRTGATDSAAIEEARLLGSITEQDAKNLQAQLSSNNATATPKNPAAASITKDYVSSVETDLLTAMGVKRDAFGNLSVSSTDSKFSVGEARIIAGQAERDINTLVNGLIQADPNLVNDPIRLQAVIAKELQAWKQQNLYTPGGKFSISGLQATQTGTYNPQQGEADVRNLRNLLNSPVAMAVPAVPQSSRAQPQNFIGIRQSPGGLTRAIGRSFNPLRNDRVFTQQEVVQLREEMANGTTSPMLEDAAEALSLTPRALLQQQSNVYGLGRVPVPQLKVGDVQTPVQGAKALMTMGFPARGAAFLSGNIAQESSWNGQRSWGEVMNDGSDRNGGLVSWMDDAQRNHYRLTRIEQHLGKSINRATDAEQLAAMKWEMRTYYPDAYRIFMNPLATDRQLIRASKLFWGYGHEGSRYEVARQTAAQL